MNKPTQSAADQVRRFFAERIRLEAGQTRTSTSLYEDYCCWCEQQEIKILGLPEFCRLFGLLGVAKARIAGRVRYLGVALVGDELQTPIDDSVQRWCNERLRPEPQTSLTPQVLYEDYAAWAEGHQFDTFSLPTFARELERLGIDKKRVAGRKRFLGVAFVQ